MKKQIREIAKRKYDPNYKDTTSLQSSSLDTGSSPSKGGDPFEENTGTSISQMTPEPVSSAVAVPQRKAPGKSMVLGKPKKV